ncbi:hypothetical protein ACLX1H_000571 [Fusarium chlamydosporum]
MSFDALPRRFSISIDGKPVAMPKGQIEEQTQAQAVGFGNDDGPAIFEIQDEHLVSGPFVMGRFFVEDRSLMPKRVSWFNRERMDQVQPVHVEFGEKGPEIKLRDGGWAYRDGQVISPLLPDMMSQNVEITPVVL